MPKEPSPFQEQLEQIQKMREAVNKTAAEHPDVKAGKCTVEDQLKEPTYLLYNQIVDSVMETIENPEITKAFLEMGKTLGDEVSRNLVMLVAVCMARSAHNAIVFYDELLKDELIKKFDQLANGINLCRGDVATFGEVMKVFKARLEKVEKSGKIADAAKEAGIDPNAFKQ